MWPRSLAGKPCVESLWEKTQLKSSTCNSYIKTDKETKIKDISESLIHLDSFGFIWTMMDHVALHLLQLKLFVFTTLAHLLLQSAQHGSERPEDSPFSVALRPISGERLGAARHRAGTPSQGTRREFIQEVRSMVQFPKASMSRSDVKIQIDIDHGGKEHLPLSKFHFIWRFPKKMGATPSYHPFSDGCSMN